MILIDTHIHIHPQFNLETFFNSAVHNFSNYAGDQQFQGILCLTESANVDFFGEFKNRIEKKPKFGDWNITKTGNSNALKIFKKDASIFIIAGRQIVTKENLEVLAIGLEELYPDGEPIIDVIKSVISKNAIPIIPWGFGKWSGERGEIVRKIVLQNEFDTIYLGDNGNRPKFMKIDKTFSEAEKYGILNLQGSDPLPFKREERKPGSYGICIEETLNEDKPFDSFYQIITNCNEQFMTYGKLESAYYFFKNQIAMQIVKRIRNK